MIPEIKDLCTFAEQAGVITVDGFGKTHQVTQKGIQDPVTEIDQKSENFLIRQINHFYPGHTILSEESGLHNGTITAAEHVWYLDPLDGTMNYSHGVPFYSISIGYAFKGELVLGVIYDPMRHECYCAEKGKGSYLNGTKIQVSRETDLRYALLATGFNMKIPETGRDNFPLFKHFMQTTAGVRRMGSAALEIAYTAAGRLDGMWEMHLSAWDVAAGFVIAREAGAVVSNLKGDPNCFHVPFEFLIANPILHPLLLKEIELMIESKQTE